MRTINLIVIHCSATPPSMDIGANVIREWHVHGNNWIDIGYHFVIKRDGTLEEGRPVERQGAHVAGHNANSIGICMVGGVNAQLKAEDNFTPEQWSTLARFLSRYPGMPVKGHRQLDPHKECPSFDVPTFLAKTRT